MEQTKWVRIMEMVFGLVDEIDQALNEVDAEPIDTSKTITESRTTGRRSKNSILTFSY